MKSSYKLIATFWMAVFALGAQAQPQVKQLWKGTVRDAITSEPVRYAAVKASGWAANTDTLGRFQFSIPEGADSLRVEASGYRRAAIALPRYSGKLLDIRLEPLASELPPVSIEAGVQRVVEDEKIHVYDYAFLGESLLLLLHDNKLNKSVMWITNNSGKPLLPAIQLPEEPSSLFMDCTGEAYALCKTAVWKINWDGFMVRKEMLEPEYFNRNIIPCAGEVAGTRIYKHKLDEQRLAYFFLLTEERRLKPLTVVEDSFALAMITDDSVMAAKGLGLTWEDPARGDFQAALDSRFRSHVLLAPVFAPLVVQGRNLLLFDHENGRIIHFDEDGNELKRIPISYHKNRTWEKYLIPEFRGSKVYTAFARSGYISIAEVDPSTGQTDSPTALDHPFVTRIMVRDGFAYYLYRDSNYDPVKRLYRMPLN